MLRLHSPNRIANRILLLVLLLELASICLWGSLTYSASKQEILNTISSKLNESAYRISSELGNFFMPINVELEVLATSLNSEFITPTQRNVLFNRLLNARPEVEEVSLIGPDGREQKRLSRINSFGDADLRQISNNDLFDRANKGERATSAIQFSERSEPQVVIATPVVNSNEGLRHSVLLTVVNLRWLWDKVQIQRIGDTGYNYVLNKDLTLVAHHDPSLVLSEIQLRETSVPSALFSNNAATNLTIYKSIDGFEVAGVSLFDDRHNWWIVVEQPVEEGLAPLSRVINRFILALVAAASITVIIVLFFSRITMRPLENLSAAISQIAKGQRGVRVPLRDQSELGKIAEGFNAMAETLDEKIEGLVDSKRKLQSSQDKLRDKSHILERAQEIAHIGSWDRHLISGDVSWSDELYRLLDEEPQSFLPQENSLISYIVESDLESVSNTIEKAILEGNNYQCEYRVRTRSGAIKVFHERGEAYCDDKGKMYRLLGSVHDITERFHYMEELEYQATHDSLTGLPNRLLLHRELESTLKSAKVTKQRFALLIFDLDRFKEINDSLGHKSGDALLKQIGPRVIAIVRQKDVVARLGGDEFAVLLTEVDSPTYVEEVTEEIYQSLVKEFDLDEIRVQVGVSIGIAACPDHCTDASTAMRFADMAMYYAKRMGQRFAVYQKELDTRNPRQLTLMSNLREAIESDDLELYYQPKVSASGNNTVSVEALLRWNHPKFGLLLPEYFVQTSELGELIHPLTRWVTRRAILDCKKWRSEGYPINVAINVSPRVLQDLDFVKELRQCISDAEFSDQYLELEITESAIMSESIHAREVIRQLGEMNLKLAIDDYGTGYSSLSYLKKIPIAELKIDKSFVVNMMENENDAVIVRSTIDLAHNLGLKVTAEGVEDQEVSNLLSILNCDFIQGFHHAHPMPYSNLMSWLANREEFELIQENAV